MEVAAPLHSEPAEHNEQAALALPEANWPTEQAVHVLAPAVEEKEPDGHAMRKLFGHA